MRSVTDEARQTRSVYRRRRIIFHCFPMFMKDKQIDVIVYHMLVYHMLDIKLQPGSSRVFLSKF